jgi:hypothetical protein
MTTPLTPAQKIVAAFNERHELCGPFDDDWVEQCLAAALRAAAEQPYDVLACFRGDDCLRFSDGVDAERNRLLAIATELETRQ